MGRHSLWRSDARPRAINYCPRATRVHATAAVPPAGDRRRPRSADRVRRLPARPYRVAGRIRQRPHCRFRRRPRSAGPARGDDGSRLDGRHSRYHQPGVRVGLVGAVDGGQDPPGPATDLRDRAAPLRRRPRRRRRVARRGAPTRSGYSTGTRSSTTSWAARCS